MRADCAGCGCPPGLGRGMVRARGRQAGQSTPTPVSIRIGMFGFGTPSRERIVVLAKTGWKSVKMLIFVDWVDVVIHLSGARGCREQFFLISPRVNVVSRDLY